jgi:hypothetical protein
MFLALYTCHNTVKINGTAASGMGDVRTMAETQMEAEEIGEIKMAAIRTETNEESQMAGETG